MAIEEIKEAEEVEAEAAPLITATIEEIKHTRQVQQLLQYLKHKYPNNGVRMSRNGLIKIPANSPERDEISICINAFNVGYQTAEDFYAR